MTWIHYRLVFRLESPLHIGYRKVGNLMQTRRYVPGKNLWAALTERIVWLAGQGNNAHAYQEVGETLQKYFRFGYLWPARATEKEAGQWIPPTKPHFPWEETDPAYWDYLYLDGTARTALAGDRRTAAEGALHEVEFIAPYTREGEPVYLVGDLWVRDDVPSAITVNSQSIPLKWREALRHLQIGGERTYGWGRVTLIEPKDFSPKETGGELSHWGDGWKWKANADQVKVIFSEPKDAKQGFLPVHALAAEFVDVENGTRQIPCQPIQGPVEAWLGWERRAEGFVLSETRILYLPGSRTTAITHAVLHPWGYLYVKP